MGLTAGLVPPRVNATVKAGLLALAAHAVDKGGWSLRRAATALGLDHMRLLRWQRRAALDRLDDLPGGPAEALHALLAWERDAIVKVAEEWMGVDRSHRKLAHRGSRLGVVHVSESTMLRVLAAEGITVPQRPARTRREHRSTEETSTQVEVAFTRALVEDGREHLLDQPLLDELATGTVPERDDLPVLVAMSDNGPQMASKATALFMASVRIARHFGQPGTPNDQAWVESFFGHIKDEHPHLDLIGGLGDLEAELDRIRVQYNTVRLHQGIGYVTPEDEHHGRGQTIRDARVKGMREAAEARIAYRRQLRQDPP